MILSILKQEIQYTYYVYFFFLFSIVIVSASSSRMCPFQTLKTRIILPNVCLDKHNDFVHLTVILISVEHTLE